jgi:hypothetical protein
MSDVNLDTLFDLAEFVQAHHGWRINLGTTGVVFNFNGERHTVRNLAEARAILCLLESR